MKLWRRKLLSLLVSMAMILSLFSGTGVAYAAEPTDESQTGAPQEKICTCGAEDGAEHTSDCALNDKESTADNSEKDQDTEEPDENNAPENETQENETPKEETQQRVYDVQRNATAPISVGEEGYNTFAEVLAAVSDGTLSGKVQVKLNQIVDVTANGEFYADNVIFTVPDNLKGEGRTGAVRILGTAELTNCKISDCQYAVRAESDTEISIKNMTSTTTAYGIYTSSKAPSITVEGGTFNVKNGTGFYVVSSANGVKASFRKYTDKYCNIWRKCTDR